MCARARSLIELSLTCRLGYYLHLRVFRKLKEYPMLSTLQWRLFSQRKFVWIFDGGSLTPVVKPGSLDKKA